MALFYLMSWVRRLGLGLTQGLKAGPGAQRGNCWGRLSKTSVLHSMSSVRTLFLLSHGSQGGANHPDSQGAEDHS